MPRLLSLDCLRALAVLLVLGRHADFPSEPTGMFQAWHRGGGVGVDLFFVLSGFLVGGILFREHAKTGVIDWKRFLIRRGFRIYPAFWCLLGATIIVRFLAGGEISASRTLNELLFVQNYGFGWWQHTWSLAVEEHFYLSLPFLLIALSRDRFASLPRITFWSMAALLVARHLNAGAFNDRTQLCATHLRFDSLLFGTFLSYCYNCKPAFATFCRKYWEPLAIAGLLLLSPTFLWPIEEHPWLVSIGVTGNAIGAGCLLCALVARGVPTNELTRLLGIIGQNSYSIYLWHLAALGWLVPLTGLTAWPAIVAYLALSIVIGIQLARLIEAPSMRLRDQVTTQSPSQPSAKMASTFS